MSKWRVDRFEWENSDGTPRYLQDKLNDIEDKGWDVEGVEFFEYHVIVISTRKEPTSPAEPEREWKVKKKGWEPIGDGRRMGGKFNRIG